MRERVRPGDFERRGRHEQRVQGQRAERASLATFAAQIPPGCVCAEIDEKDRPCIACEAKAVLEAAPRAPEQR